MDDIQGKEISSDEDDIFQCGRCKSEYSSLSAFKVHKLTKCKKIKSTLSVPITKEHLTSLSYDPDTSVPKEIIVRNLKTKKSNGQNSILLTDNNILSPTEKKNFYPNTAVQVFSVHPFENMDENEIVASVSNLFSPTNNSGELEGNISDGLMASNKQDLESLSSESMGNILPAIKTESMPKEESLHYNHELFHGSLAKPTSKSDPAKKKIKQKCSYCGREFVKHFDLQQHIRSHTGEKPFQCLVCGRSFAQKSNVRKHMETHKVWPTESIMNTLPKDPIKKVTLGGKAEAMFDDSYVCYFCEMSHKSYIELRTHMKFHIDRKVYKCVQVKCEQTFGDMNTFISHVQEHGTDTQYRCHTCSKYFDSLESLGSHRAEHSLFPNSKKRAGESYFRCTKCLNKYSSPEALEYHLRNTNHHFPCPHCSKIYSSERLLRRHLHIHGQSDFISCSTCKKEFKNIYRLKLHLLTHTGERAFRCQICIAAFYRKDGLKRHMLIHSNKKLKCPFRLRLGCMREFRRTDKLRAHMLSHVKDHKKISMTKNKQGVGGKQKKGKSFSITISVDSAESSKLSKNERYESPNNAEDMEGSFLEECEIMATEDEAKKRSELSLFEERPLYEQQIQLIDDQKLSDEAISDFTAYDGGKKYEIVQIPFDQSWEPRSLEDGNVVIDEGVLAHASAIFSETGEPFVASEMADLSLFVNPHVEECASIELTSKDVSWNETS